MGVSKRATLLNEMLEDKVSDVAIAAAVHIVQAGFPVSANHKSIQHTAARVLEAFALLPSGTAKICGIKRYFRSLFDQEPPDFDWRLAFGNFYREVERHAVWCRALSETNITASVNAMDVFNDWLLFALFNHDPSIGNYNLGQIGSILECKKLIAMYPATRMLAKEIHEKRSESALSHPVKKKGGLVLKNTGRIKFGYIWTAKKLIHKTLVELASKW